MEMSLLYTCLVVLAVLVALNLKLTLHLFELIRNPTLLNPPFLASEVGEPIANIKGRSLSKKAIELTQIEQAIALLFLSSRCPQCKEKLPEIEALVPLLKDAGLTLLLVTNEPKRHLVKFLKNTSLLDHVFLIDKASYKSVNPTMSTPYYLFVNHLTELQAGGVIGDEDWQSFVQQMDEMREEDAAA